MESESRCNGFKFIIIPHKSCYGDLPIKNIISDLNYLKSKSKVRYGIYPFYKTLENVINKLKDENHFCKHYNCNYFSLDEKEVICMFLVILDYIVRKLSSDSYFRKIKEKTEEDLNVRVYHPSVKKPVLLDNQVLQTL